MKNEEIIEKVKKTLNENPDVCVRELFISGKKIDLIFLKSTVDKKLFSDGIISPLIDCKDEINLEIIQKSKIKSSEVELIEEEKFIDEILRNKVILIIEGEEKGLSIDIELLPTRPIGEPPTSPTIQGPREGFTESLKTTIAQIRKQFQSRYLVIKNITIGKLANTQVGVFYLSNVAEKKIVKDILKKLKKIDTDGIVDSHYLIEYLSLRKNSLFEQCGSCEKPDIAMARMMEGRIAIAIDGSPIIITIPYVFFEDVQNANDYYTNPHYATYLRYIRIIGIIMATVIPGVYLSLRLYHYKIVPLKYILTINATTQNLPFTPFLELLFILILFQILYEVSLRLPRYLGLATSIVGALVLGDTGVQAGLISPPGTIVIALSIFAAYTVPNQAPQLSVLRIIFIFVGATLGLLGIVGAMVYFVNYLNTLNQYGTPYLAPYAPKIDSDLKDGLKRKSVTEMKKRPMSLPIKDRERGDE